MIFFHFSLLLNWPLFFRLGGLKWQEPSANIAHMVVSFFLYSDGNNFNLMFELCGDMDLLGVNARL
jgi:hypothetical protein